MIARAPQDSFADRVAEYRQRVENRLERAIDESGGVPARLTDAMRYSVLGGGKRIRPLLCYASAEYCGVAVADVDAIAAAVELVHAYSLVHDDLPAMDDDDLRRGRPTTHRQFDEATAILTGDALQALAFEILCADDCLARQPSADSRIVGMLARAVGPAGMVGGQMLDLEAEGKTLDESGLEAVHRRKTGQLIWASIMMPGVLSAMPPAALESLDAFARDIGLVFQIRDDLLEVEQDTATLGKNAGSDAANEKSTYPSVLGLAEARRRADTIHSAAMASLTRAGGSGDGLEWVSDYILKRAY